MSYFQKISDYPSVGIASPELIGSRLDADYYRSIFVDNEEALRNSGYQVERLGKMWSEANYGSLPDSIDYSKDGVFLIRGTDIRGYSISPENELVKVPETYFDKFKKARVFPSDLLVLVKGASIDRPDSNAIMPEGLVGHAIINGSVFKVRLKSEYDKHYVAAFMFSRYFLLQKRRSVTNTGALYNDLETIENYQIVLPEPKIQAYIGDKVRLAEKCREEANKLYEASEKILTEEIGLESVLSTGVDESRVLYEHHGSFAVLIEPKMATDRLDAMGYHPELLGILSKLSKPKCQFVSLDQLGNFAPASQGTIDGQSSDYFVSILHLDDKGVINWQEARHHKPITKGLRVHYNDVLISRLNPKEKRIGVFNCKEAEQAGCSSEFSVFKAFEYPYYLAFVLSSHPTHQQMVYLGRGTSSSRRRIDEQDLKNVFVPNINCRDVIDRHIHQAVMLWHIARDLIDQAVKETEQLIKGALNTKAILNGQIHSLTWDEILTELNK